eukprot:TRINITY_DN6436_c0_g1_i1.p1 TRINITY_DN6436_c0_g1~~TRINITY_DN6436_c0_g1_i1.p1  ORF type:complete len:861 (-),score=112.23 TRINITY_DN6436_c0_g1_i1:18-2501(-)
MAVAEALYQAGYISYPRTETDRFNDNTPLMDLLQLQLADTRWGAYVERLVHGGEFLWPRAGSRDDSSHPPIHPTKPDAGSLVGEQKVVYEYVARHFIACCSRDAVGHETTIRAVVGPERESFTAKGLMVSQRNFLDVFIYERWAENSLPVFTARERVEPASLLLSEGTTTAPALLTEAELIQLMDKNGIGTDATMAEHIHTIQKRKYAEKQGNFFLPSRLGIALVLAYESMGLDLAKPLLRCQMETDMRAIADGRAERDLVVSHWVQTMHRIYNHTVEQAAKLDAAVAEYFPRRGSQSTVFALDFSHCGKCEQLMDIRKEASGNLLLHCDRCQESYVLPRGNFQPQPQRCVLCKFQALLVTPPDKETSHSICPHCFSNPPQPEISSNFRCFMCSAGCPLAGKANQTEIKPCPSCTKSILLKRWNTPQGQAVGLNASYSLVCSGSPQCNFSARLPACVSATVSDERCQSCRARMISFVFKSGQVPLYIPLQHTVCAFECDPDFADLVRNSSSSRLPPRPTAANPPPLPSSAPTAASRGPARPAAEDPAAPKRRRVVQDLDPPHSFIPPAQPPPPLPRPPSVVSSFNSLRSGLAPREELRCRVHNQPCQYQANAAGVRYALCGVDPPCDFLQFLDASTDAATPRSFSTSAPASSWRQSLPQPAPPPAPTWSRPRDTQQMPSGTDSLSCPTCHQPCDRRRVVKDGPNQGRWFFKCERCNFFQFQDEVGNTNPASFRSNTFGAGAQAPSNVGAPSNNACFSCGKVGHYSSACPTGRGGPPALAIAAPSPARNKSGSGAHTLSTDADKGRPKKCGHCRAEGHTKRTCPQLQT